MYQQHLTLSSFSSSIKNMPEFLKNQLSHETSKNAERNIRMKLNENQLKALSLKEMSGVRLIN
jgi:hypothetical protein